MGGKAKLSIDIVISRLLKIDDFFNKYSLDKFEYKSGHKKSIVICNIHGEFLISPKYLFTGSGCRKCSIDASAAKRVKDKNYLIEKIKKNNISFFDNYSLDKFQYSGCKVRSIVTCFLHGDFDASPQVLMHGNSGCKLCATNKTIEKKLVDFPEFKKRLLTKYPYFENKYLFKSELEYTRSYNKITITCKEHGDFMISPNNLMSGKCCRSCAFERNNEKLRSEHYVPNGWNIKNWETSGRLSSNYDSYKLYIEKCENKENNESFFKIGRTFRKTKLRMHSIPYNTTIIKEIIGSPSEIFTLEVKLKRENKQYSYLPKVSFNGKYECFSNINF